jgi:DNA polymerase I-like protein with 3'-5' exonuclease and polymerase domains
MLEHARRNILSESDPDYYDIHSQVAVLAFGLDCAPTKGGLNSIGKGHLRVVAKSVIFGVAYGRGAKAIALAAKEEGIQITVDEAQRVIDTIFQMYPRLAPFFEACRRRVRSPGWLKGFMGRLRRFAPVDDFMVLGDYERQAMNFPIQNLVAELVARSVDYLHGYRREHPELTYRMVLQIHDSIILEVPIGQVPRVVDEVLPECMIRRVPIHPTTLSGRRLDRGPYHLGIDIEPGLRWGESMTPTDCLRVGLDPRYAKWVKVNEGWTHPEIAGKVWVGDAVRGELVLQAS